MIGCLRLIFVFAFNHSFNGQVIEKIHSFIQDVLPASCFQVHPLITIDFQNFEFFFVVAKKENAKLLSCMIILISLVDLT